MRFRSRQRTALIASGAALLCTILAVAGVLSWWTAWNEAGDRIAEAQRRIARVQWILDHGAEIRPRLDAAVSDPVALGAFIPGETPEQATNELQQHVKQLIDASSARIISMQPLPVLRRETTTLVAVRYQVATTPRGLTQLLHLLETGRPHTLVDSIEIVRQPVAYPSPEDTSAPAVIVQIEVQAFMREAQHG